MKTWLTALAATVFGAVVSLSLVGTAQSASTPPNVAFVSPSRITTQSNYGRGEATRAQGVQQQKTNDLRAKQQVLETTRQQLATTTDAAARLELQQRELQQRTELERLAQQTQAEMQTLQRDLNNELLRRLRLALDEVVKTKNYQLVLNGDTAVLWWSPDRDITADVVARMNAQP